MAKTYMHNYAKQEASVINRIGMIASKETNGNHKKNVGHSHCDLILYVKWAKNSAIEVKMYDLNGDAVKGTQRIFPFCRPFFK